MALTIRDATDDDLPGIVAIYNDAVLSGTAIWSTRLVDVENRRAILADRQARSYPFLVADQDGAVVGYASFGDFRPFDGYFKTVEHSVYVHPGSQRRGIAAQLMPLLMERGRALGKHVMVGGIDATNLASIALHRRFGFVETGRMPQLGFKFDRYLDLVFMQRMLD